MCEFAAPDPVVWAEDLRIGVANVLIWIPRFEFHVTQAEVQPPVADDVAPELVVFVRSHTRSETRRGCNGVPVAFQA